MFPHKHGGIGTNDIDTINLDDLFVRGVGKIYVALWQSGNELVDKQFGNYFLAVMRVHIFCFAQSCVAKIMETKL